MDHRLDHAGQLADTALDLVASVATLAGVWVAGQPADDNHRFGHGKAEALSALFQVVLIGVSAVAWRSMRCSNSLGRAHRRPPMASSFRCGDCGHAGPAGVAAPVLARTRSIAIATDHLHYQSDLFLNLAVIAALVLDQYAGFPAPIRCLGWASRCGWAGAHGGQPAGHRAIDGPRMARRKKAFSRCWPAIPSCAASTICARAPAATAISCSSTCGSTAP
jgi:ferrous-iron efflux pump FieF